jgi:hypothetical protein
MSEHTEEQVDQIEALFVQSAHGLTSSAGTVTFHGLAHATLFFSDRPQRVVGHLHSRKFVDQWGEGENSFAEDPPNAVVSFLEDGDATPEEVTGTISNPQLDGDTLTYECKRTTPRLLFSFCCSSSGLANARKATPPIRSNRLASRYAW